MPDLTLDDAIALETRVWRALQAGDPAAEFELLDEDFVGVYPTGFADRADHVRQLDRGPSVARFEIGEPRLLVLGDAQVLFCYRADYARPGAGCPTESMYVSSLWAWRSGRWVNVFSQDTVIDPTHEVP